ncbi:MAG TPA: hypothetical protein VNT79_05970 [Phycisphaerae bacterium]|nr:hypothetical protein [Phycisphaerae bacterium]
MQRELDSMTDATPVANQEAMALRRKVQFWRRAAWLMGGLVVLVVIVAAQRSESSRIECIESLQLYTVKAADHKLEETAPELVAVVWEGLVVLGASQNADHYAVIGGNWSRVASDASFPVAICRHPHVSLFGRGRNVLYKEGEEFTTGWLTESAAAPILREAGLSPGD